MIDEPTQPPAGRYPGPRRLRQRGTAAILGVSAMAAIIGVVILGYQRLGAGAVRGDLYGYQLIDDHAVAVTIKVTRSDPSRPAVCIVRVRAADGSETGRREVLVTPSESTTVQVKTTLRSSQPPMMGDIYGCGDEVPGYLHPP